MDNSDMLYGENGKYAGDATDVTFEETAMAKIKKNLQQIAQFRENAQNIGPILKAKFDKKVADLEGKNATLQQRIEHYRRTKKAD